MFNSSKIAKKMELTGKRILNRIYSKEQMEMLAWNGAKKIMPYISSSVEGGKYVFFFNSHDAGISDTMFRKKRIYEGKELDLFFRLTKQYYGYTPNERETIFLDIGGNIGTMSVLAKTKYDRLEVIGFEPSSDNAKLFKLNIIVNDKEDIQIYNMAISDFDGTADLFLNRASCVEHILMMNKYRDASRREAETVEVMKLDSWCEKYEVPMDKIGYICLDVEGHENAVLEGGKKVLSDHAIPIWMEISSELCKNGSMNDLIRNVSKYYNFYIDKRKPYLVKQICELKGLIDEFANYNSHTDVFLIK